MGERQRRLGGGAGWGAYVNGAGDAGVPLTKRTVEVRNVNAARENVVALTKSTVRGVLFVPLSRFSLAQGTKRTVEVRFGPRIR